jgi:TonB-linked SusC/RagA family outer membrane protein
MSKSKMKWLSANKAKGILTTFLFFIAVLAFAQTRPVTGTVLDGSGENVVGATVSIKGTNIGTVTDSNGYFTINAKSGDIITIGSIGYVGQSITLSNQTNISVTLKEDTQLLDEVVVVGYGVQKKSDVTGALSMVSAKDLTTKPVVNAFDALQGKVAGVDITTSQRPGELGSIRIRGVRSLVQDKDKNYIGNDPLYVVDGVILASGGIETINPRDIESISVLKDASSTAIYGSRGANGVVLVTTNRGKDGQFKLNYSGNFSWDKIHDLAPSMNASDYVTWRRWAYYNANPTAATPGDQPSQALDEKIFSSLDQPSKDNIMKGWANGVWDGSRVTNTDWTNFVTQTGVMQEHTINASGGTERMKSYISVGYLTNDGTQRGQKYERYNFSMSTDIKPNKWFSMGGSVNASWGNQSYGFSRTGQSTTSGPVDLYSAALQIYNVASPYYADGTLNNNPGSVNGVYTVIDEWNKSDERRQTLRALGSFYANIDFGKMWSPLEGLVFKSNLGPDYRYYRRGVYLDNTSAVRQGGTSYAAWNYQRDFTWVLDNILTYTKSINDHKFDIMLLQSAENHDRETAGMSEQNVPKSSYKWNNMGAVDITNSNSKASMGTGLVQQQRASYGARLNYALKDRYLLTLSGRYDGASVLSQGHKWTFFPSAALGWRVDQESFMEGTSSWLQQLKLRLGVGMTGNSVIEPYATLGNIISFYVPFGGSGNTLAYGTNEPYYSANQVLMANPALGWEKTTQYNLGIDFSILKGRIGGTVDLYKSNTKDLLMQMTIPTITGYPATMANVGKTKNQGVDVSLNFVPVNTKDFVWNSIVNAAWQKDEIVELANGKQDMTDNRWFIGYPLMVYYGYTSDGLWQESDAAEMAKWNENGYKFEAGMVKPHDVDHNYTMDANDMVKLNSNPRWTFGWSNSFNYKGIELNIELYGRFKYTVATGGEAQGGVTNQRQIDYWRPDNTGAEFQKPIYTGTLGVSGDSYASLIGVKDASYLKFRNVSLGYFLPKKVCKSIGASSLKVYGQLRNPGYLYSSINWLDLDFNSSYYNRGVTLGVDISF